MQDHPSATSKIRSNVVAEGVHVARAFLAETKKNLDVGNTKLRTMIENSTLDRSARFVSGKLPQELDTVYQHPRLVALAKEYFQTDDIALYMNRILLKDKTWSAPVPIHQDMPYFHGGTQKLSVFVPLDPMQAVGGNGGLVFVKQSHKYGVMQRGTIKLDNFPPMPLEEPDLHVGDVVFMDFLTWHYSGETHTPTERAVMQIVYQPATDGSHEHSLQTPTLVTGQWQTTCFSALADIVIPDAAY